MSVGSQVVKIVRIFRAFLYINQYSIYGRNIFNVNLYEPIKITKLLLFIN